MAAEYTLIHEPDGRLSPVWPNREDMGRKRNCNDGDCERTATYFSAVVRNGMPTLQLCGPHMGACKRHWNKHDQTWAVLSPGAPELAAFDKANVKYAEDQYRDVCRRMGYR